VSRGSVTRRRVALALLAAVGASNVVGSAVELVAAAPGRAIAALGRVSLASPLPKVFCKMGTIEPFARRDWLTLRHADGTERTYEVDRAASARLPGPYTLRNVYGAALVFAPLLPARTTNAVVRHGVCKRAAWREPADEERHGPVTSVVIASTPRPGGLGEATRVEVPCEG